MAEIPVVKHNNPMKLADGNYHLYPTTIDLVKMPDGSTPAFDMEDGWTAANSTHLGGRPAEDYALKGEGGGTGVPAGGSAGQTLVKQSDEEGNAVWANPNLIDSVYEDPDEEVQTGDPEILPIVADDASKLGGQQPSYYATAERVDKLSQQMADYRTAVNLGDNTDFTNPVNQRGQTSYTAAGYTIDRWMIAGSNPSMTISSGVTLGDDTYLQQRFVTGLHDTAKTYTAAVYYMDGTVGVSNAQIKTSSGGFDFVNVYPTANKTIKAVAIYEGEYTDETIPPYVPKGYTNELLACEVAEKGDIFDWKWLGASYGEALAVPKCSEVLLYLTATNKTVYSFSTAVIPYVCFETAYIPMYLHTKGGEATIVCSSGTVALSKATLDSADVTATSRVEVYVR